MTRYRFSAPGLLAVVVVSVVGCAAWHNSSKWWRGAVPEFAIMNDRRPLFLGEELELIERIRTTTSAEQRSRLTDMECTIWALNYSFFTLH
jgi:hypothetical protein